MSDASASGISSHRASPDVYYTGEEHKTTNGEQLPPIQISVEFIEALAKSITAIPAGNFGLDSSDAAFGSSVASRRSVGAENIGSGSIGSETSPEFTRALPVSYSDLDSSDPSEIATPSPAYSPIPFGSSQLPSPSSHVAVPDVSSSLPFPFNCRMTPPPQEKDEESKRTLPSSAAALSIASPTPYSPLIDINRTSEGELHVAVPDVSSSLPFPFNCGKTPPMPMGEFKEWLKHNDYLPTPPHASSSRSNPSSSTSSPLNLSPEENDVSTFLPPNLGEEGIGGLDYGTFSAPKTFARHCILQKKRELVVKGRLQSMMRVSTGLCVISSGGATFTAVWIKPSHFTTNTTILFISLSSVAFLSVVVLVVSSVKRCHARAHTAVNYV